jgi:hypothetical protein
MKKKKKSINIIILKPNNFIMQKYSLNFSQLVLKFKIMMHIIII